MIEIQRGVPLPGTTQPNGRKYPWGSMKIGDSFYVPNSTTNAISAAACSWKDGNRCNWQFTVRKENSGARIWRIK